MDFNKIKQELTELTDLVKEVFSTPTEYKFKDYKLEDGTIVRTDTEEIGVGTTVTVISEQGEAPIADGNYKIVDGETAVEITVSGGLVSEVKPVEAPATEEVPAEEGEEEMAEENQALAKIEQGMVELANRVAALESKLGESENKFTEMQTKYNSEIEKLSGEKAQLKGLFEKMLVLINEIGGQPQTQSVAQEKKFTKTVQSGSKIDQLFKEAGEKSKKLFN